MAQIKKRYGGYSDHVHQSLAVRMVVVVVVVRVGRGGVLVSMHDRLGTAVAARIPTMCRNGVRRVFSPTKGWNC